MCNIDSFVYQEKKQKTNMRNLRGMKVGKLSPLRATSDLEPRHQLRRASAAACSCRPASLPARALEECGLWAGLVTSPPEAGTQLDTLLRLWGCPGSQLD